MRPPRSFGGAAAFVVRSLVALSAGACAGTSARPADAPHPVTSVVSAPGPLPLARAFAVARPAQTLFVSASAYAAQPWVTLEVQVVVDGAVVGRCRLFSNDPMQHRALVCPAIPLSLAPGEHEMSLRAGNDWTATDPNDQFEVTLSER